VVYSYQAYGLSILSEIYLPELHVGPKKNVDIEIKLGKLDSFLQSCENKKTSEQVTHSEMFFFYKNVASFLIIQDKQIIVDPVPGNDEKLLRLLLLSRALGAILYQHGLIVLHGSAVVSHDGAVVFLGQSGNGKSAAAASLKKEGYSILADEVVAIDIIRGKPFVFPAFPQLKLLPDVAEYLGFNPNSMLHASSIDNKFTARFDSDYFVDPIPLKRIYLLEKGESTEIHHLGPQDSTIELVRNSYSLASLNEGINMSLHFSKLTKIVKNNPIRQLVRSSNLKDLAYFAQMIDEDIRKTSYSD
jgi:hypothetical protein